MKRTLLALAFLPTLSFAQSIPGVIDTDWRLQVSVQGSLNTGQNFESLGHATFTGLETMLTTRGGYNAAYRDFRNSGAAGLTYGVWQEAVAFQRYLKDDCSIDVPLDLLASRLGIQKIFATENDTQVNNILTELGQNLNFEQKIRFGAMLGGVLVSRYDNTRAANGTNGDGIVTFRDMIAAHQSGGKSGVCRDMAVAVASSLKTMGVDQSYVVAYQTANGGHAVVLAHDPNNPSKTYNLNYNYVTSTESGSSTSHLRVDGTIPSVGTQMRIFTAEGRPITVLPSHLGIALEEISGRRAREIDPMLRSESHVARAEYRVGNDTSIIAGTALTPDGDRVLALSTTYEDTDSEHFPSRMSITLYNNERETVRLGTLSSTGVYASGEQWIVSSPLTVRVGEGTVSTNLEGKINFNGNVSWNRYSGLDRESNGPTLSQDFTASAGTRIRYENDAGTVRVEHSIMATGGLAKADVRNEGSFTFDLRDVRMNTELTARITDNLSGFGSSSIIARTDGLGVQGNQEVGFVRSNADGSRTSAVVGTYGPILGEAPAFVPGARRSVYGEIRRDSDRLSLSAGGFCERRDIDDRTDCGARATATVRFGGRRR